MIERSITIGGWAPELHSYLVLLVRRLDIAKLVANTTVATPTIDRMPPVPKLATQLVIPDWILVP